MIRLGVVGYGNLGKSVVKLIRRSNDYKLIGVFSRRYDKLKENSDIPFISYDDLHLFKDKIDVLLICHGSKTDLIKTASRCLQDFNTIDAFDTHKKIEDYYKILKSISEKSGKSAVISVGWDPGLFSLIKGLFNSLSISGNMQTFWGKGVSEGHSEAVRSIFGVSNAICYTVPNKTAILKARKGKNVSKNKFKRICYLSVYSNSDRNLIKNKILGMKNYFSGDKTKVYFKSEKFVIKKRQKLFHKGEIIRTFTTGENKHLLDLRIKLGSNPDFTASVMLAYAKALFRLISENKTDVYTILDIPISYLFDKRENIIREFI